MYSIWDLICPYCNKGLKKIPKSKTKCQNCGNYFYIRTDVNGSKFAVTEVEKNRIDNIKHRRASRKHTFRRAIGRGIIKSIIRGTIKGLFR